MRNWYSLYLALFFLLATFVCYYKFWDISILSDDNTFIFRYSDNTLASLILHNFHDNAFTPIHHIFGFILVRLFGFSPIPHHIFAILLHVLNAIMIYHLLKRIGLSGMKGFAYPAFAAILFLLYPYQTEAVNWIAARTYLLCTFFLLISLNFYLTNLSEKHNKYLIYSILFYFVSLFCKEISLSLPFLIIVFEFSLNKEALHINKLKRIALFFAVTIVYWVMRVIALHDFIGGYGREVHLNFSFELLKKAMADYSVKFFTLYRYSDFIKNIPIAALSVAGLIILVFIILKGIRTKRKQIIVVLLLCFFISLIPVINLETISLSTIQSDRYGYLASIFASIIIVEILYQVFPFKIFPYVAGVLALTFGFLTFKTNQVWIQASKISDNVAQVINSESSPKDTVYILNLPDNYKGVYLFRNSLNEYILMNCPRINASKVFLISLQYIENISDGVTLTRWNDTLDVKSTIQHSFFIKFNENSGFHFFEKDGEHYKIKANDSFWKARILYFNKGKLERYI